MNFIHYQRKYQIIVKYNLKRKKKNLRSIRDDTDKDIYTNLKNFLGRNLKM